MLRIDLRNKLWTTDPVKGATVEIDPLPPGISGPTQIGGVSSRWGTVNLDVSSLADGDHTVRVTPQHQSAAVVGPTTASGAHAPDRVFRPIQFTMRMAGGNVTLLSRPNRPEWVNLQRVSGTRFRVDLQPVWIVSQNSNPRGQDPTLIIVHHTGGPAIGPAIIWFAAHHEASANYIIDTDGQIVKMVDESRAAWQAGVARWAGSSTVNAESLGIEIVHRDGAYPEAQYTALLGLLERMRTAFPSIPAWNIIGHSDIAVNGTPRLGRKSGDPGSRFEWTRLENRGLGMIPAVGPMPSNIYGSFFADFPTSSLRNGDNDSRHRFGAANRPGVTGSPVEDLQQDLTDIGYYLGNPDGDFGSKTHYAVMMFQEHFFASGRGHKAPDGRVDFQTGSFIRAVLLAAP